MIPTRNRADNLNGTKSQHSQPVEVQYSSNRVHSTLEREGDGLDAERQLPAWRDGDRMGARRLRATAGAGRRPERAAGSTNL